METNQPKRQRSFKSLLNRLTNYFQNNYILLLVITCLSFLTAFVMYDKQGVGRFAGIFFATIVMLFVFCKDLLRYKPLYIKNPKMLLLLALIFAGTLAMIRVFSYLLEGLNRGLDFGDINSFVFGIPVPIGAMLITLIFDFHTAIIFSFLISLITGIWLNDPSYTIFAFIGSLTGAFSIIRCKKRSAFIKAGILVSIANLLTAVISLLVKGEAVTEMLFLHTLMYVLFSGIAVASLISVLLPVIEYGFSITTDISLLELLDLEHPLMKSLMISAPGTYHHSIIVGNLAEAAAEAVGANPLLARVAAYYHDIGKVKMPEYFVENQSGGINRHDKLTPHMSSMILISHVKEGVELAKQHGIPNAVTDIIQQHHGKSLITFFYQKAIEQGTDDGVLQEHYRYPGPKPQTRVAALVMMADAVEAASRALIDPTPSRISALVDRIVNNIFLDGQIDECELTLKDISEIKKKFTFIITSIFHKRISYPPKNDTLKQKSTGFDKTNLSAVESETKRENNGNISPKEQATNNPNKNPTIKENPS